LFHVAAREIPQGNSAAWNWVNARILGMYPWDSHLCAANENPASGAIGTITRLYCRDILGRDRFCPPKVRSGEKRDLTFVSWYLNLLEDSRGRRCISLRTFSSIVKVANFCFASCLLSFGGPLGWKGLSGGENSVSGVVLVSMLPTGEAFRSRSCTVSIPPIVVILDITDAPLFFYPR